MAHSRVPARGSVRSRAAATLGRMTFRPLGAAIPVDRPWGVWAARQTIARVMDAFGPPLTGAHVEQVDTVLPDGRRLRGEWVTADGVARGDAAVYYVHGSGYALCSPRTHRRLTSWLSRRTGLPVFVVDYRLAPRHRFPTAATDVRTGWDWLLGPGGLNPGRVVVAGDSAGGHLAVDLLLQPEVSQPAGLVMLSPVYDMTFGLARAHEELRSDPVIRVRDAQRLVGLYCTGTDLAHPRLTLDVARGRPMPPTLIQAGGAEFLVSDARALAADIRAAGGDCELQVWPDQVHVFQALPRISPEAGRAMRDVAQFVTESLDATAVDREAG